MFKPQLARIVSTTTRQKREGEVEGFDYHYISLVESLNLEGNSLFAELVTFRGIRYGVTKFEMEMKMKGELTPAVILEPEGVKQYEKLCIENDWDIFKVYVSTPEAERIKRLNFRTSLDIRAAVEDHYDNTYKDLNSFVRTVEGLTIVEKNIARHTDRLQSITGEERRWLTSNSWDCIVPGDDSAKAIQYLEDAVKWRNQRRAPAQAIGAVTLPL